MTRPQLPPIILAILFSLTLPTLACGPFFYAAPPALDAFPERHAVKTLAEFWREDWRPEDPTSANEIDKRYRDYSHAIGRDSREQLLEEIDDALQHNREGEYEARLANLLHELREMVELDIPRDAAEPYLVWRRNNSGNVPRQLRPSKRRWNSDAQYETRLNTWRNTVKGITSSLTTQHDQADEAMQPFWRIQIGASFYRSGDFERAADHFGFVRQQWPDHPRAEVALLMLARSYLGWSRQNEEREEALRNQAKLLLAEYRAGFPDGRFVADVAGWQGGIAWDRGDFGRSLEYFMEQSDVAGHPEVELRALEECDRCIETLVALHMEELPETLPFEALAEHPRVAMRLVYHLLDNRARDDFSNFRDDYDSEMPKWVAERVLPIRREGRELISQLAGTALSSAPENGFSAWDPRYVALIAWNATETGDHEAALDAIESAGSQQLLASDDLHRVRGVALQRLGRYDEAADVFAEMRTRFPNSPLLADTRFRLTTCLIESKRFGEAIEVLMAESALETSQAAFELNAGWETELWLDTLLNFAPIEDLKWALSRSEDPDAEDDRLARMTESRLIARGRFAEAKKIRLLLWTEETDELTQLIQSESDSGRAAELNFKLAEHWKFHRGEITLPSLQINRGIYRSEHEPAELFRRRNAVIAGFQLAEINDEVDRRDELWHAQQAYAEVVRLVPETDLAAEALEGINECLIARAEFSPFSLTRAEEADFETLSRSVHAQLLEDHPDSLQAERAVFWSFPKSHSWTPGDISPWMLEMDIAEAFGADSRKLGSFRRDPNTEEARQALIALADDFYKLDDEQLLTAVRKIRADFKPHYVSFNQSSVMNNINDIEAMLTVPGVTAAERVWYHNKRLGFKKVPPVPLNPAENFRDFLGVLTLRENETIPNWEVWLKKYPNSPKREAVLFRVTRLTFSEHHSRPRIESYQWPESPTWNGYKRFRSREDLTPEDLKRVTSALDRYQTEFPNGRYAPDIRMLRGEVAIDSKDWDVAVKLLTETLDDTDNPDLRFEASLSLAEVFVRLHDDEFRSEILKAIRDHPPAQARLKDFMESPSFGSRLALMEDYCDAFFAGAPAKSE
ncbi:MAG: tetratricopeptide (TPR) repeat protein [Verrucomicrobiales bacterium]|jgi:tetratricopeptide (TPR) repeat protein